MSFDIVMWGVYLAILAIMLDISINIRRLMKCFDRIWRKLAEINDSLQKNKQ